jgi:hypothetical protein
MPPAIRYAYDRPFELDPATWDEAMNLLEADPPTFIVDTLLPPNWNYEAMHRQPIQAFLDANYDYAGKIGFADLYRLRE